MRFLRMVCVLLLTGACTLAGAQNSKPTAARGPDSAPLSKGEIKAMRDFKLLDFNGDGKISRTEVALFPRLAAAFSDADTNRDNYLSYEEVRAYAVRYRAERDRQRELQQAVQGQNQDPLSAETGTEGSKEADKKP